MVSGNTIPFHDRDAGWDMLPVSRQIISRKEVTVRETEQLREESMEYGDSHRCF